MSVAEAVAWCLDLDRAAAKAERLASEAITPHDRTRWQSHADSFATAARDMRRKMEAANMRQPTSNTSISRSAENEKI
jgi:hypothetical protein